MQFSLTFVAFLASGVAAQSVSGIVAQIPSCALTCLATGAAAAGCAVGDYACQCGEKRAAITTSATPCVLSGCAPEVAVQVIGLVNQLCTAVQSGGTGSSSSAPAATTTQATTTTQVATTTAATTEVKTSTSAVVVTSSTLVPSSSTKAPVGTGSMMPSSTRSPTPSTTPIQVSGATIFKAGLGLVGAAVVGALAL